MGHAIRAITDQNPRATVPPIDGIGAFDHVYRSAMMSKLVEVPGFQGLLPFVRTVHAQPSSYVWEDAEGRRQQVCQHEGGEQGDALMPLLLAVHHSLEEVHQQLEPGEELMAFLDDTHVVSEPDRTRPIFNLLAEKLFQGAGIRLHEGKTRVWNRGGECPAHTQNLGPDLWNQNLGDWGALSSRKQQRTHGWKRSVLDP